MIARLVLPALLLAALPAAAQDARQAPAAAPGLNSLGLPGPRTGRVDSHSELMMSNPRDPTALGGRWTTIAPGFRPDEAAVVPSARPALKIPAGYVGFYNQESFGISFGVRIGGEDKDVRLEAGEIVTLFCDACLQLSAVVVTQAGAQTLTDTFRPAARDLVILRRAGSQLRFARP